MLIKYSNLPLHTFQGGVFSKFQSRDGSVLHD